MLVGRVIQGAAGGIFPLAFGIIRDEFPRARVAGGIGLMSALLGVGGGAGVVLAGPIVDHLSYHYLFWLPLIPIVDRDGRDPLLRPRVANPRSRPRQLGRRGADVGRPRRRADRGQRNRERGAGSRGRRSAASRSASFCSSLWVRSESRSTHPLVDMRMMRIRGVWTTNLVALLLGFGMYSSFILLPQYVETPERAGYGFGASVTQRRPLPGPVDDRDADRRLADRPAREALRLEAAAPRRRRR